MKTIPASETAAFRKRRPRAYPVRLHEQEGVLSADGKWTAVALPAWLRLEPIDLIKRFRWVRLSYSSGFFDEPIRPLIRFVTAQGKVIVQPMNGAAFGSAEWVGRVPNNVVSASISPVRRLGPFSFRIDKVEPLSRRDLVRNGWRADRPWTLWSLRARLLNSREEAWQALKYAQGGTPHAHYKQRHNRLVRVLDFGGFDLPQADWAVTPAFHFFLSLDDATPSGLRATITSLGAQIYKRWSLHAVASERTNEETRAAFRQEMLRDDRLHEIGDRRTAPAAIADTDMIAILDSGDVLENYALAAIGETLARQPALSLVYSDEDAIAPGGGLHAPVLKPNWSPAFYRNVPYLGRLTCLRSGALASCGATVLDLLSEEKATLDRVLAKDDEPVGHVRRILCHRREAAVLQPAQARQQWQDFDWPAVTVVIPTRDHADLLFECVRGLKEMTNYPPFETVIVDNGSTQPEARKLLAEFRASPRCTVLERPGPFNFSQLCNDGARIAKAPMLVFLNNDIKLIEPDWLKALVRLAVNPRVGVVGSKLLFPNGLIQHAGVVVGMGGLSGHNYRRSKGNDNGYLNQLESAREVLAVTAACIAVEREKFDAVGGFDAENLPVDLNDIDLCLRIAERGWTNMWTPEAVMIHAQSGSRGIDRDPFELYRKERTYFAQRWAEAIRDDPYFHPALSLFSQRPELA